MILPLKFLLIFGYLSIIWNIAAAANFPSLIFFKEGYI